jgi:hypothetical protein
MTKMIMHTGVKYGNKSCGGESRTAERQSIAENERWHGHLIVGENIHGRCRRII